MTVKDSSDEHVQAVRRVYENANATDPPSPNDIFHVTYHLDPTTGKGIILWDDILAAFKNVVHVKTGTKLLSFLKGQDFKNLDPLRIAASPEITLDVVVAGSRANSDVLLDMEQQSATTTPVKKLSVTSLRKALPTPPKEQIAAHSNSDIATNNTIRRSPAYGLVEEALENYTHIENPATAPRRRGPQLIRDNQSPADDNDDDDDDDDDAPSKPQQSPSMTQHARRPQENTSGTTRDFVETVMKAAQGDKDAQVAVGDMYKDGQGVAQDYQAAMDWYLKAAEQDDPVGQRKVGLLYDLGLGVTQNHSTAMEWYLLAAEQGSSPAQRNIGLSYKLGEGVTRSYSKAMEWFLKAADQGDVEAQESIGWLHQYGMGVPKDYVKAMTWYRRAADQGNADAQCHIGYMYDLGLGVPQDGAKAASWYRKSAEQGESEAQYNLGLLYSQGRGVRKDNGKAMTWFKKAADQGDTKAKNELNKLKRQASTVQAKPSMNIQAKPPKNIQAKPPKNIQAEPVRNIVQKEKKKPGLFKRFFGLETDS